MKPICYQNLKVFQTKMIYLRLSEHNIIFNFFYDRLITESETGKWLDENNIDYKINDFSESSVLIIDGECRMVCGIDSMLFYNEEDIIAFKLRWAK